MTAAQQWVVLELTAMAEGEDPEVIRASICHHIRDAEVFVPASVVKRGDTRIYQYLVDGYAFMLHKHPEHIYSRLTETKYVQGVLYTPTGKRKEKVLSTISSTQINEFKSKIKVEVDPGIEVGDTVAITSGMYKHISAVVQEEIKEQDAVTVHMQLRSTARLLTLPRAFLRLESKATKTSPNERVGNLTHWVHSAQALSLWQAPSFDPILNGFRDFVRWQKWQSRVGQLYAQLQAFFKTLDFSKALEKQKQYRLLDDAHNRVLGIHIQIRQMERSLEEEASCTNTK